MHRSGTSLVASWLQSAGLRVHHRDLMGPAVGNERGHFEDLDFVALHNDLLLRRRPDSFGWQLRDQRPVSFDATARREARALIATRSARYPLWGWKDPPSTLFLADWADMLPALRVVLLWRPAAAVVDSLLRRSRHAAPGSRIDADTAVRTWLA